MSGAHAGLQRQQTAIIHQLGEISATGAIIARRQEEQGREIRLHTLQLDRLEHIKPSNPSWWQTDKFWLTVAGTGAALAGMPDLAKMLIPH